MKSIQDFIRAYRDKQPYSGLFSSDFLKSHPVAKLRLLKRCERRVDTHGNVRMCYTVCQLMKTSGIEWEYRTYYDKKTLEWVLESHPVPRKRRAYHE